MARIRSIKPEFWTSEQVVECSPNARLLFIGMWTFADDSGVLPASAKRLKMQALPADGVTADDVSGLVGELIDAGLVEEYDVDGKHYWRITGFTQHQRIDQPTYRYPLPDGLVPQNPKRRRTSDERSPGVRRTFDERSPWERSGEDRSIPPVVPPSGDDAPATKTRKRGTYLPDDWELPDDWRAWTLENHPGVDPDQQAQRFRDYWLAKTGRDASKRDWFATWRNWVRRAPEMAPGSSGRRGDQSEGPTPDDPLRGYAGPVLRRFN